jgi:hypothetical protein
VLSAEEDYVFKGHGTRAERLIKGIGIQRESEFYPGLAGNFRLCARSDGG